jgi:hypothetical protein
MRDTFHPSVLFTVTIQEHRNQPKPEMCIRMAASRFWCVAQHIDVRCVFTSIHQVLSGKVPYWWIPEESQVLVEKGRGTEPFLSNLEV